LKSSQDSRRSLVTVVAELPVYTGNTPAIDYSTSPATFTVCRLLRYTIEELNSASANETSGDGATEHALGKDTVVFQINHARIVEPKTGDNVCTNQGDRLFPECTVIDQTGAAQLRMTQKAALNISGLSTKETFTEAASNGALNFPILNSLRVTVRNSERKDAHGLDAVIVEAGEQDLLSTRAIPNASMNFLAQLLDSLTPDPRRMIVAPITEVRHIRHAGMVVDMSGGEPLQAGCVLTLIAHKGKSVVQNLLNGHRIVTKGCWNVPFEEPTDKECGAPEHADKQISGEIASYCTMQNVEEYTLSTRKPTETKYALIVITSMTASLQAEHPQFTYMADKVSPIDTHNVAIVRSLLGKLARIPATAECRGKPNTSPTWQGDQTPFAAKRARRLSDYPTDADTPSPTH